MAVWMDCIRRCTFCCISSSALGLVHPELKSTAYAVRRHSICVCLCPPYCPLVGFTPFPALARKPLRHLFLLKAFHVHRKRAGLLPMPPSLPLPTSLRVHKCTKAVSGQRQ